MYSHKFVGDFFSVKCTKIKVPVGTEGAGRYLGLS